MDERVLTNQSSNRPAQEALMTRQNFIDENRRLRVLIGELAGFVERVARGDTRLVHDAKDLLARVQEASIGRTE